MVENTAEIDSKRTEINDILRRKEKITAELEQNETQVEQLKARMENAQSEFSNQQESHDKLKAEIIDGRKHETQLKQTFNDLGSQLQESQQKFMAMKGSREQAVSKNRILTELKNAMRAGKIGGIIGRLGDLGTIDEQFDIAITTACGGYLDWIVVENVVEGEKAIKFLRENRLGRASFLVLEQINKKFEQPRKQPFNTPANSKRLFDLVKPASDKYLNAFFFAIRDNLVCETIDIAQNTAFNLNRRHRVVTLGGDLFEPSGNISGGGQPKKGGMSSKVIEEFSESQIQQTAELVREKEHNLTQCRHELQEITNKLSQLTGQMLEVQRQMENRKSEIQNYQTFLKKEEQKVSKVKQQEKAFEAEVQKVDQINQEMVEKQHQQNDLVV